MLSNDKSLKSNMKTKKTNEVDDTCTQQHIKNKVKTDNVLKPDYENWICAVRTGVCKVSYEQYLKDGIVYGAS